MTTSILKKFPRPEEPPPYPGRSVIINYDIDDPLHWKNKLEKKLDFATTTKTNPPDGQVEETTCKYPNGPNSLIRPSPVATGAALTLAELKRKQLNRRQAPAVSPGNPTDQNYYDIVDNESDEAEVSLEERLKKLLEKVSI